MWVIRVKYYETCKVNEYPFLTLKTIVKFPGNAYFDSGRAIGCRYLRLMELYARADISTDSRSYIKYIFSFIRNIHAFHLDISTYYF